MGRTELFKEVAEKKLKRAEKELHKLFKSKHQRRFDDKFWDLEWKVLHPDGPAADGASAPQPFGVFDKTGCDSAISISFDGSRAESRAPQWVGTKLHLSVRDGEVSAFAVEVLDGL